MNFHSTLSKSIACLGLTLLIVGGLADAAAAQEKIQLKLNLKKGDSRKVNFKMLLNNKVSVKDTTIDMRIDMGMYMTVDVKDVGNDGLHTMDFTYDRITMKIDGPIAVEFDSDDDEKDGGALGRVFGALAGQTITITMAPTAKVKEVSGFEDLAKKLGVPKEQLESQRDQMTQMIAALPEKLVGIGDYWSGTMKMNSDPNTPATVMAKYTLVDRKGGNAIVKLDGTIASEKGLNGSMNGTMVIDEATGWTESGKLDMAMKGDLDGSKVEMKGKMTFGGNNGQ